MKHIKTYKIFESVELIDRDDIEEILLPLKDIGVGYEIGGEQILGKDFVSFDISKFKVRALHTIPDYMVRYSNINRGEVYMASFDPRRNTYMILNHDGGDAQEIVHSSHLEIIGYKWKDLRDEVLHLVSFMLDEGYFFFYNNSIKVSEVVNPKGKGLTWMEEDVLNKSAGKGIEMLESLDPESNIAELRISFAKKLNS
jgi:hypothetical protein